MKIRPGEFSVVTGVPGSGKSEFLDQIIINLAQQPGWQFAICSFENPPDEHLGKLAEKYLGMPFWPGQTERMSEDDLRQAIAWLNQYIWLIRSEAEAPTIDWLLDTARAAVMRHGVRGLIVDPWNEIEHRRPANMTETEFVSQTLSRFKRFAEVHDCHVWIVAHPAKMRREDGKIPVPSLYDISGSANWANKADLGVVVHRSSESENGKAFYRGVMGPVGSGKSTAMCMEIMRRARQQRRSPDGTRRTRLAVIRNTYRELKDTTLNTWLDWFPQEHFGEFNESNMRHLVEIEDMEMDVLFRALDRPRDVAKVLSLELTGAWVNEARELPKGIVDALGDRVGRYPAVRDGGCTWRGVIMDTNPPDEDHWWYRLAEEERPPNWEFFRQPGGLIEAASGEFEEDPKAENLNNLEPHYYLERVGGKAKDHVRVYYCCRYGFVLEGKPVWSEYRDEVHCSRDIIPPMAGQPLYVGLDFGLTPAALFAQRTPSGRWIWIDELVTEDMGTTRFAELLGEKVRRDYAGFEVEFVGDPSGDTRSEVDERTPFDILNANAIPARAAPTNDFEIRREAVAIAMNRMYDGKPGFQISPKCRITRKGLAGGYAYKRVQVAGDERFHDKPDKNRYSHPCEAGQYAMLGAGEGRTVIPRRKRRPLPKRHIAIV